MNISSSTFYKSLLVSYGDSTGTIGNSSDTASSAASGKKRNDSFQLSPESIQRFAETQDNPGSLNPSKVDLNTDDKKRILAHLKERFASTIDTTNSKDTASASDSSDSTKTQTDELAKLKEQLSSLDLDTASEEEISAAFTQFQNTLPPWDKSDNESTNGYGPMKMGGGRPPMGGTPPMDGMNGEAEASQNTGESTTEQTAQQLLDALIKAYNNDEDGNGDSGTVSKSKSDYVSQLKEQITQLKQDSLQQTDDVYGQLMNKLDEWASDKENI